MSIYSTIKHQSLVGILCHSVTIYIVRLLFLISVLSRSVIFLDHSLPNRGFTVNRNVIPSDDDIRWLITSSAITLRVCRSGSQSLIRISASWSENDLLPWSCNKLFHSNKLLKWIIMYIFSIIEDTYINITSMELTDRSWIGTVV